MTIRNRCRIFRFGRDKMHSTKRLELDKPRLVRKRHGEIEGAKLDFSQFPRPRIPQTRPGWTSVSRKGSWDPLWSSESVLKSRNDTPRVHRYVRGMIVNLDRRSVNPMSAILMPSTSILPSVASTKRKNDKARVDLPPDRKSQFRQMHANVTVLGKAAIITPSSSEDTYNGKVISHRGYYATTMTRTDFRFWLWEIERSTLR